MSQALIFENLEFSVHSFIKVKIFGGNDMKLTNENANIIKVGDVVRFTYPNKTSNTGVVYGIPADGDWGILCNRKDGTSFGHGTSMFTGEIDFEVLEEHEPVAIFGMVYDFVSNHQ
jgi:hypothetical protein